MTDLTLTQLIEIHERGWGNINYGNRPSLAQLLNAQYVMLWKIPKGRFVLSAHTSVYDMEEAFWTWLGASKPFPRKLELVFRKGVQIKWRLRFEIMAENTGHSAPEFSSGLESRQQSTEYLKATQPLSDSDQQQPQSALHTIRAKIRGFQTGKVMPGRNEPLIYGGPAKILPGRNKIKRFLNNRYNTEDDKS